MEKKILDLPMIGKWYNMTVSGMKMEEYREIKPYWISRMFMEKKENSDECRMISSYWADFYARRPYVLKRMYDDGLLKFRYTHIRIRYGYSKQTFLRAVESVRIGIGNPEWGAPCYKVIIIKYEDL